MLPVIFGHILITNVFLPFWLRHTAGAFLSPGILFSEPDLHMSISNGISEWPKIVHEYNVKIKYVVKYPVENQSVRSIVTAFKYSLSNFVVTIFVTIRPVFCMLWESAINIRYGG